MLKSKCSRRRGKGAISTVDFIKRNLDFTHRALTDAANGTDEQLHFVPADGSHSIAWCLWHTARVEDLIVNARIGGGGAPAPTLQNGLRCQAVLDAVRELARDGRRVAVAQI
jgi:uncharacterized damage-inducible protein DinB